MLKTSAIALALVLGLASAASAANPILKNPPANFKKVSTLVKLPELVPGLGVLYVDPATLPVGPFLSYDKKGKLINITYMPTIKLFEAHKDWKTLGSFGGGITLDHTDILYNAGHPGVAEPHYHIVQWLIPHNQESKRLGEK
ncbi:MAG TPA: hypothetical protein DD435_08265 [Cyanobacteria bacterium UBA8530]|nr:hypothetical protein [Cyanobacteria bacterium UBA8530]